MPRSVSFRHRTSDVLKLKKLQTSALRKSRRLKKEYGVDLVVTKKDISDFGSRQEFNKYIKKLEKITDRKNYRYIKNDIGVVIPRNDYTKLVNSIKELNRKNEKRFNRIKEKQFKSRGKDTLEKVRDRQLMGDTRYSEFKEIKLNLNRFTSVKDIKNYQKYINQQLSDSYYKNKAKEYKANYIKGLRSVFDKLADKLINKIKYMPLDNFMEIYYTEDIGTLDFVYELSELKAKLLELETLFGV